jgi:hypothetical protein
VKRFRVSAEVEEHGENVRREAAVRCQFCSEIDLLSVPLTTGVALRKS